MAYRIRYGGLPGGHRKRRSHIGLQTKFAVGMLSLVLLGDLFSAQWRESISVVFLPQENQTVQTLAAEYAQGECLRQILVEQCRRVLIEAGYEG